MKTILVDAINGLVLEDGSIFQPMYELLEKYPNDKLVLTGAFEEKFTQLGLDKVPYKIFTQSHNPEKTDPAYYKTLLSSFDMKPEDLIYFEHNPDAVKTAESVGIKTYFYDHTKADLLALKSFIDANLQ